MADNAYCCNPEDRPNPCERYIFPAVRHVGPHPGFNICRDGDYPSETSMVINFLYIGEGSCAQYYRYAKEGRIQRHMSDPVKFFAHEPCGCGEYNTVMRECMDYLVDNPGEAPPPWLWNLIRNHPQAEAPDWMVDRMPAGMLNQIRPGWAR
jgi:hypothetical protein